MDDREVLAAVARRDRAAFEELFRRYAPRVKGFLVRALGPTRAEEVAQEVLLRVWHNAPRYDPVRASPATWIFTIARNARIDALRRTAHATPDPADPMWVPAAEEAPDAAVERRAASERIRSALDALPEQQLEVLDRAYLQGQTLAEVADALAVPLGTVKSRVRLAMERLRLVVPDERE
jgi:RNA polymerase sigma-70 factor (ECF subfamily)